MTSGTISALRHPPWAKTPTLTSDTDSNLTHPQWHLTLTVTSDTHNGTRHPEWHQTVKVSSHTHNGTWHPQWHLTSTVTSDTQGELGHSPWHLTPIVKPDTTVTTVTHSDTRHLVTSHTYSDIWQNLIAKVTHTFSWLTIHLLPPSINVICNQLCLTQTKYTKAHLAGLPRCSQSFP